MKRIALKLADLLSLVWRVLPGGLRRLIIKGLMVLETRGDARQGLSRAFMIEDDVRHVINERALVLGHKVHPKHRLIDYHTFFIDRIPRGANVLDVGCSYGAVARSIAAACPESRVLGIDYDEMKLTMARNHPDNPPNLSYLVGDATKDLPAGSWSVIVLSNVLEHIVDRVGLLRALVLSTHCDRVLIRVPYFERDWTMPMRRELGINYYNDSDHKIEHTALEFENEMARADLTVNDVFYKWGEIWAIVTPK